MSLVLTRMQNFRAVSPLGQWVTRPSEYGGVNIFAIQTASPSGIVSRELQQRFQAGIGNVTEVPVFDHKTVTISNSRPITVPADENTSRMVPITATTYQFGFTMTPSQHTNNEHSYQQDFNHKLTSALNQFLAQVDTACLAVLSTNKTQVIGSTLGKYTVAANVLNATNTQRLRIIGDLNPMQKSNDFYAPRHIVGNPGLESIALEISEQGLYNEQNRAIQWANKTFHFTNRLTDAAGKIATGYSINEDCLGMLHRVDRDAMLRHTSTNGYEFNVVTIPGVPFPMGLMYYSNVQDQSALHAGTADMTATVVEGYSFSVDLSFFTNYVTNIATRATPILAFDIDLDDTL